MAALKLLNLLALASLALLACSFNASPANALSLESHNLRRASRSHSAILKKKRQTRCRPRPEAPADAPPPADEGAPPPPPPPPSGGGTGIGGGKAGLATLVTDGNVLRNLKSWKSGFIYTWSAWVPDAARELGIEGAPMLWGDKSIEEFARIVKPGYARVALGFNEPNEPSQANMNPWHAADVWRQYMEPLRWQGYKLVSPACTNGPSGISWMHDFMGACGGCGIDAVATHYYGTSAQGLIDHISEVHNAFGRNIWLTEFACQSFSGGAQCSRDQIFSFMSQVTGFMDSQPWVEQYMAFGMLYDMFNVNWENQLLGGNGYPTDLGRLYLGL
jgi:hypothetical protein